jgi:hypothetical protein
MTLEEDQKEMRARMQALKSARRKSRVGTQPETGILQTPSAKSASPAESTNTKSDPRDTLVIGPARGKCETCGRPTSNPRFCSRSCAAVTNNAVSPKRKVEGECQRCRTAIKKRKQYCEACQAIVEAETAERQRRRDENYRSWLTLDGQRREGPIVEMSVTKVYRTAARRQEKKLRSENMADELIDQLIGICFTEPPYLRKTDAMRYVSLLNELKAFEFVDISSQGTHISLVKDVQIRRLPAVLESWVNSYFGEAYHPMMPAYALDTGRLIEFHVEGSHQLDWNLEGMVEAGEHALRPGIFDSSFRKYFTTRFGGLRFLCQVPETGGSVDQPKYLMTLRPNDKFLIRVERCHLSIGWGGSGYDTICTDTDLECDLMSEFRFDGELFVRETAKTIFDRFAPNTFTAVAIESEATEKFSVSVPARWITHAVIRPDREDVLLPVPRWNPDDLDAVSARVQ